MTDFFLLCMYTFLGPFLLILSLMIFFNVRNNRRAEAKIYVWANRKGYSIDRLERRYLKTPWFWKQRESIVYYVDLTDHLGMKRKGFLHCRRSLWDGNISDFVQVHWDK